MSGPSSSALLGSELLRLRSRRATWVLGGLVLLGVLAAALIAFLSTGTSDAAALAQAERNRQSQVDQANQSRQQCLADPTIPEDQKLQACGPEVRAEDLPLDQFLPRQPFRTTQDVPTLVAIAGAFAGMAGFLLAATSGGADWNARTVGLLLTWEPRRTRVFVTRLTVVTWLAVMLGLATMALAGLLGAGIGALHGEGSAWTSQDTGDLASTVLRIAFLVALGAVAGYSLAMLARSTGFALGVAAAYLAVVEPIVNGFWPWARQWLVQTNVAALMSDQPLRVAVGRPPTELTPPATVEITQGRAWLTLLAIGLLLALAAWQSFRRRDLS